MIIKNFLFHRVSEQTDPMWPPMTPQLFEKVIRSISRKCEVVLLEEYVRQPRKYKRPVVTLSFDDGYKDNLEVALPLLQKYSCPASFYVVTDCVEKGVPPWTYICDAVFSTTPHGNIQLHGDFVPPHFRTLQWSSKEEGTKSGRTVKPWMKQLVNNHREDVLSQIIAETGYKVRRNLMMNWQDLSQIKERGFYIGSHSHSHPMLGKMATPAEIVHELQVSKELILKNLGHDPITISYPIGSWDERVLEAATKTGYKIGLAVEQREYDTRKDDLFAIPRIELYNEPWWKVKLRMTGLYHRIRGALK